LTAAAGDWLIGPMATKDKSGQTPEQEREARLAEALRANLRRRKQAAPPKPPSAEEK
jgi:hypothetical protein